MEISSVNLIGQGNAIEINLGGEARRYHALWLRDNARDAATRSPSNGQRLITILDIPRETTIAAASVTPEGDLSVVFAPEGKSVRYSRQWLADHAYDSTRTASGAGRLPR